MKLVWATLFHSFLKGVTMVSKQGAPFVAMPRTIHELRQPLSSEKYHFFVIEKTIGIPRDEYENYLEDMVHWRLFIENNAHHCRVDDKGVWHCILVQAHGQSDGVLIMADGEAWTKFAAYYVGEHTIS